MGEKIKSILEGVGTLYDFAPYESKAVKEKPPTEYIVTAFEYIHHGLKTSETEAEGTRQGRSKQLELI